MHDEARRQIVAQQTVVRRGDDEVSAQQIEPLRPNRRFSLIVKLRARRLRAGRGAAPLPSCMTCRGFPGSSRMSPAFELQRPAAGRIFQRRGAGQHGVIRDFVRLARPLVDPPGRAVGAAQVEPAAHRHHLEQPAEPIHASPPKIHMRRLSI